MSVPITAAIASVWMDTSTNWNNANVVVNRGVLIQESNTGKIKIADGTNLYPNLPYLLVSSNITYTPLSGYTATNAQAALDYLYSNTVKISYNSYATITPSVAGGDLVLIADASSGYSLFKSSIDTLFTSRTFLAPQLNGAMNKMDAQLGFNEGVVNLGGITSGTIKRVNVNSNGIIYLPVITMTSGYTVEFTVITTQNSTGNWTFSFAPSVSDVPGNAVRFSKLLPNTFTGPAGYTMIFKFFRMYDASYNIPQWFGRLIWEGTVA